MLLLQLYKHNTNKGSGQVVLINVSQPRDLSKASSALLFFSTVSVTVTVNCSSLGRRKRPPAASLTTPLESAAGEEYYANVGGGENFP